MKMNKIIMTAVLAASIPLTSTAAPLVDGSYSATDYDGNRTVWGFGIGGGLNSLWSFASNAVLLVSGGGTAAQLLGTIENLSDNSIQMAVDINLTAGSGTYSGYCQFNGAGDPGCDNTHSQGLITNGDIDPSAWNYFDIDASSSTITGLGTLAGLSYDISDRTNGNHPAQIGTDANALADNDLNGMSFWFDWTQTSSNQNYASSGHGDFNLNLSEGPDGELNEVPLPAAGWMLIAALGGLAAAKRRKAA